MKSMVAVVVGLSLFASLGMPKGMQPVTQFELDRYLGTWYEIARLDHRFERGMTHVTATYSLKENGDVKVLNRGYVTKKETFKQAAGRAKFVEGDNLGYLKVSFFGPFYGSYVVFELDDNYQYAFVSGPDTSYLWLLSRTPTISDEVKQRFLSAAQKYGFDTNQLIWVNQTPLEPKAVQ